MSSRRSRHIASMGCFLAGCGASPSAAAAPHGLSLPQRPEAPLRLAWLQDAPVDADGTQAVEDLLQVYVGGEARCGSERVAMAGRTRRTPEGLTFTPAFGFAEGVDYVVRVPTAEGPPACVPFRLPTHAPPQAAVVTGVFPSGDTIPENTLRFYLHFSVPMAPHVAFDHIALRDASGVSDDAAFMRFKQELWSEDRTRLTVLVDPGRIKRDVATNRTLGPALEAGTTYQLTVRGGWPSADGTSELSAFSWTFTASAALRVRPDVSRWRTNTPCVGQRDPLVLSFDRPFDRHRLRSSLGVVSAEGQPVEGAVEVDPGERGWRFTPRAPWSGDDVAVVVDPTLEDVAGNSFRELLDRPVHAAPMAPPTTSLPVRWGACGGVPR